MSRALGLLLAGGAVLVACTSGSEGDGAAFCAAMAELRTQNPFEALDVASPEDMRDAFRRLEERSAQVAEVAPTDARVQAQRYDDAVGELVRELSGAGYDPRLLDGLRYREATDEYTDAAVSLDNTARSVCS